MALVAAAVAFGPLSLRASEPGLLYSAVGHPADANTETSAGLLLMGGGTDVDAAFEWLIRRAGGGDILVLRADGADAYNQYLYDLGRPNSAATLIVPTRAAAADAQVLDRVRRAEALFIAGGDQADYVRAWKGTPLAAAIEQHARRAPLGGTSAGLAILGEFSFAALNDTIDSGAALADPFDPRVTLERRFLRLPLLAGIITDSHFVERDRMGRLLAFMARILEAGWAAEVRAIAIDRETAVAIEPDGRSVRFGAGDAYFLRAGQRAQLCRPRMALRMEDVEVYRLTEAASFDLKAWCGQEGVSYRLSATDGRLISDQERGAVY